MPIAVPRFLAPSSRASKVPAAKAIARKRSWRPIRREVYARPRMLTDYHLHLRPDEEGTTFERFFTAENVDRYLAAAAAAGIEELGVSEHVYRFRAALDLWRHPLWVENAQDDIDAYCEFVRGTPLRLGVECDYVPGAEERVEALLGGRDFDYVVGSVHFIGEGAAAIDHKGFDVWEGSGDPDEVWRRYFG